MTLPLSPHHPIHSGEIVTFTGSYEVDTQLRDVQAVNAVIQTPSADVNYVTWALDTSGPTVKLTLSVLDSTFTLATNPATVSWSALGK